MPSSADLPLYSHGLFLAPSLGLGWVRKSCFLQWKMQLRVSLGISCAPPWKGMEAAQGGVGGGGAEEAPPDSSDWHAPQRSPIHQH